MFPQVWAHHKLAVTGPVFLNFQFTFTRRVNDWLNSSKLRCPKVTPLYCILSITSICFVAGVAGTIVSSSKLLRDGWLAVFQVTRCPRVAGVVAEGLVLHTVHILTQWSTQGSLAGAEHPTALSAGHRRSFKHLHKSWLALALFCITAEVEYCRHFLHF